MTAVVPTAFEDLPEAIGSWPQAAATVAAVEFVTEAELLLQPQQRRRAGLVAGGHYDDEVLFLGTVLHEIGRTDAGHRPNRFEVDGANRAVAYRSSSARSSSARSSSTAGRPPN
ncbi:hypothetical protein [Pseudarthrobacter albicanus]|uniref:hypothetical protein n=1 Tax=Pseudarthrobacter albicanus TaxID=2823873 RepID=UPI001BAB9F9C|nr:hypothetical protein [Pseudarthrobacter albicanus]